MADNNGRTWSYWDCDAVPNMPFAVGYTGEDGIRLAIYNLELESQAKRFVAAMEANKSLEEAFEAAFTPKVDITLEQAIARVLELADEAIEANCDDGEYEDKAAHAFDVAAHRMVTEKLRNG